MASYLKEDDLDEEQARRSILVSNIPENFTHKDVIIHFQRERNGGGEVDSGRHLDSRDPSVVVVTFDHPETVESVLSRPHRLDGSDVIITVQRYPTPVLIPEVFEKVQAKVNVSIFSSAKILSDVLGFLQSEFGVEWKMGRSNSFHLKGNLQQIISCHEYILEIISRQDQDMSAHPVAAVPERDASQISNDTKDTKGEVIYQSVPIILNFIFTVPQYRDQLLQIEKDNDIQIRGSKDGHNVIIRALPSCTREKFEDGCEKYITLYKRLFHESSMMSQELVLRPGENSPHLSAKEAIDEIQQYAPVAIEQVTAPDTWLFYGEQNEVKKAVRDVCKLLSMHNPLKRAVRTHIYDSKQEGADNKKPVHDNATSLPQPAIHDDKESPTGSDTSLVEEFLTKKGYRMTVKLGDITEEQVDVIVNCNDEFLNGFSSGLPKVIVDKGGKDIQLIVESQMKRKKFQPGNIIETEGGSLRCSKVMHIITSAQSKKREISKIIKDACFDCLRKTHCNKLHSIAFPAVGAGNTGLALKQCVTAMINAVEEYMKTGDTRTKHVKDIRFVHLDPVAFDVFKEELIKRYGDCRIKPKDRRSQTSSISEDNVASYRHRHQGDISVDDSTHKDEQEEKDRCPICLEHFTDSVYLEKCKHQFCRACIEAAFKHKMKCPTCSVAYGMQTGNMPQGTMHDRAYTYRNLPGYERYGVIEIEYHFPSGIQGQNHPNPGQRYTGTSRVAYLPDCREGREVLGLLRKAFDARLTFTIGTSVTTGYTNTVTWNDIHHKTAIHGGPTAYGYPDPGYLKRVKEELAAKGIS